MKTQNEHWRKKSYQKANLETKLLVVDQILNGQLSTNKASKKIRRSQNNYFLLVKKIQYFSATKYWYE